MILEVSKDSSTHNDFKNKMKDGNIIVLYYANWCGYCQMMKPEWDKFKSQCNSKYNVAEVESEYLDQTGFNDEVEGFPTIKYYDAKRNMIKFEGDRTADSFLKFMKDNAETVEQEKNNNKTNSEKNSKSKKTKSKSKKSGKVKKSKKTKKGKTVKSKTLKLANTKPVDKNELKDFMANYK